FSKAPKATKDAFSTPCCFAIFSRDSFTSSPLSNTTIQTRVSPALLTSLVSIWSSCAITWLIHLFNPQPAPAVPLLDRQFGIFTEPGVATAEMRLHPGRLEFQHHMHFGRWR